MRRIPKYYSLLMVMAIFFLSFFHNHAAHGRESLADNVGTKILVILIPRKSATLSAEILGVVKNIHYEMGEKFDESARLIDLDTAIYYANKKKEEAILISADTIYRTNHKLYNQNSVSENELAKAKADFEIAKANVSIAEKKLAACSIRAPYLGRVVKLLVNENELVQQGQPLIEIVNDHIMRAKFFVPLAFKEFLHIGQILDVNVRGINKKFKSKITHISPQMESNTSTFQMFAEIDNSGNILRGGMTGEITLKLTKGKY